VAEADLVAVEADLAAVETAEVAEVAEVAAKPGATAVAVATASQEMDWGRWSVC
jgi:hypothetical protein